MIERVAGVAAIVVVVVGIVLAFLVIGPPGRSRLLAMDRRRADDIVTIRGEILAYSLNENKGLPATLGAMMGHIPEGFDKNDPQTGRPYEYRVLSPTRYMLCATFALPQQRGDDYYDGITWYHGAGHTCYTIAFPGDRVVGTSH